MFTGRRFDYDTGLYYYRARYYNPYIGRFLQTDPIGYGDGINWYRFCSNNPVNLIDPTGLRDCNTSSWDDLYAPDFNLVDITDSNSCYGRLLERQKEAMKEIAACSSLASSLGWSVVECLGITAVVGGVTGANPLAMAGTFLGCGAVATSVNLRDWAACRDAAKCDLASAYESYDYCMCKEDGHSTKYCAKKYLHDQEDPLWARIFSW